MTTDTLRYDKWIEDAMRGVIRRSLAFVASEGLPGDHHFYITFRTRAEGVEMADFLRARHPDEMTIVLQNQFSDLEVGEDLFAVSLTFDGRGADLRIPFAAVTGFVDPSVNFGLQLKTVTASTVPEKVAPGAGGLEAGAREGLIGHNTDSPGDDGKMGEVITLDVFRKK